MEIKIAREIKELVKKLDNEIDVYEEIKKLCPGYTFKTTNKSRDDIRIEITPEIIEFLKNRQEEKIEEIQNIIYSYTLI